MISLLIVLMANVHMKLRWRTPNARDDAAASIKIVDDAIEHVLVVVRVDRVSVVKVSRLAVSEVIVRMRS